METESVLQAHAKFTYRMDLHARGIADLEII